MKGKRGFELAFSSIVVIVLSLFVLIALFLIFSNASSSFKEKIGLFTPASNIDTFVSSCNNLASTTQSYEYCCEKKTARVSSKEKLEITCLGAMNQSWGSSINELNCEGVC